MTPASSPELERGFRDQLIKVIYERNANCPRCKYSLNGMVGTRCPECGLVVEEYLRVVDTMPRRWSMIQRRLRDRKIAAILIVTILVFVTASVVYARVIL